MWQLFSTAAVRRAWTPVYSPYKEDSVKSQWLACDVLTVQVMHAKGDSVKAHVLFGVHINELRNWRIIIFS